VFDRVVLAAERAAAVMRRRRRPFFTQPELTCTSPPETATAGELGIPASTRVMSSSSISQRKVVLKP
jgi:hypothetical protein